MRVGSAFTIVMPPAGSRLAFPGELSARRRRELTIG